MKLFGLDTFDERIEAVFNKAGNAAFNVTWIAAIAVIIVRTQILGYQDFDFELLIGCILLPGIFAHFIVTKRNGISRDSIVDEQYRNGYYATYLKNRFWQKSVSAGLIVCVISIAHIPYKEWSWFMLAIFSAAIVIGAWLEYMTIKNRVAKEDQTGALKEELE